MQLWVVDDDPTMRALVRRAAQQMHFQTVAAPSLEETRRIFLLGERPDLLVTDLMFGDGTGVELVRFLRRARVPAPAILMTGSPEGLAAHDRGLFVDVLVKPFRLSALFDALVVARRSVRPRHRSNVQRRASDSQAPIYKARDKASGEDER